MNKLVDGLYIFIMTGFFFLAGWSFLFGGVDESVIEDMCLMIFVAVLSIAMLCCVLMDKKDEEAEDDRDK